MSGHMLGKKSPTSCVQSTCCFEYGLQVFTPVCLESTDSGVAEQALAEEKAKLLAEEAYQSSRA